VSRIPIKIDLTAVLNTLTGEVEVEELIVAGQRFSTTVAQPSAVPPVVEAKIRKLIAEEDADLMVRWLRRTIRALPIEVQLPRSERSYLNIVPAGGGNRLATVSITTGRVEFDLSPKEQWRWPKSEPVKNNETPVALKVMLTEDTMGTAFAMIRATLVARGLNIPRRIVRRQSA
jgi:hypothetical protein